MTPLAEKDEMSVLTRIEILEITSATTRHNIHVGRNHTGMHAVP